MQSIGLKIYNKLKIIFRVLIEKRKLSSFKKNKIEESGVNYSQLFSKKLHLKFKKPIIITTKIQF